MEAVPNFTIYNMPTMPPNWDRVGIFYISFCIIWTILVFFGMVFCWANRHNPILKIRGLPLSFSAITFLHAYWILAQITYPIGRTMPVVLAYDIQYFFMGIWFPLGIALFHASNSRFLYVSKLQRQFTNNYRVQVCCNGAKSSWLCRLRNTSYTKRLMIFIGIAMVAQVLLTVGMWLACRKYHPSYGIPGTEIRGATLPEQLVDLGRGWEWWPSVLWQVIWTWIVAPILIWKAWGIRDTMGWRAQTIGCCISNLHATPMFLIAQYAPAFQAVNAYFTPSQWIHLSIMMFEIFAVFVPVFHVIRLQIQCRRAASNNARLEGSFQSSHFGSSIGNSERKGSASTLAEKGRVMDLLLSDEDMSERLLTMSALEHVLREDPVPLQDFSALNDFSGENIAFLRRAAKWKSSFPDHHQPFHGEQLLDAYNSALEIYTDFVSPRDAEFPLNLYSQELRRLEDIFETPARIVHGQPSVNPTSVFDAESPPPTPPSSLGEHGAGGIRARYTGEVHAAFSPSVFDSTQSQIKYLVLTNTWPKFVEDLQERRRRRSRDSGRSYIGSAMSQMTLASRVSSLIHSFVSSK